MCGYIINRLARSSVIRRTECFAGSSVASTSVARHREAQEELCDVVDNTFDARSQLLDVENIVGFGFV